MVAIATCLSLSTSASATAEPIRLTIHFQVGGDNTEPSVDPDFGSQISSGAFSLLISRPLTGGLLEDFSNGLGADQLSLSFADTAWSPISADVVRVGFDAGGTVTFWQLAGVPSGLEHVDHSVFPDILISSFEIDYTTRRSLELGIFTGPLLSWEATITPVPNQARSACLPWALLHFCGAVSAAVSIPVTLTIRPRESAWPSRRATGSVVACSDRASALATW